jgi:hypothetical protein
MQRGLWRFLASCSALLACVLVASWGCSGSNNGGSTVTAAQACADVAAARCQKMQACNPQGIVTTYGDVATCEARQSDTCVTNLGAPQTANTPSRTEECAQAIPGTSCPDYELGNTPPTCQPPSGPRDAGSPCSVSGQCGTAFCLIEKTASCGICAPAPAVGASCVNSGCGPGLVCDSATQLCAAPVASGERCDDSSVCTPGLTCIVAAGADGGTCVPLATTVGAYCDVADGGTRCDGRLGLYCNVPEGRVCDRVATAAATFACGTIDGGVIDCSAGAFCQRPGSSRSGICVVPAVEGGSCDTADGPTCSTPARCVLGTVGGTTGTCTTTNPAVCN